MTYAEPPTLVTICPSCLSARPPGANHCPKCGYDFQSFVERYGATPAEPDLSAREELFPTVRHDSLWGLVRAAALLSGLTLVALAIVAATRLRAIPNWQFPLEVTWIGALLLVVPILGGVLSLAVEGRYARGVFKGALLGFLGWSVALAIVGRVIGWGPDGLIFFSGLVINVLLATLGTALLRLALLLILR
jgi:hypothetical protein